MQKSEDERFWRQASKDGSTIDLDTTTAICRDFPRAYRISKDEHQQQAVPRSFKEAAQDRVDRRARRKARAKAKRDDDALEHELRKALQVESEDEAAMPIYIDIVTRPAEGPACYVGSATARDGLLARKGVFS